jgi:xylan 1,4-beta-xylosidase
VAVLLTNHAQPRQEITSQIVRVRLANGSEPRAAYVERVDQDHANAQALWQGMGTPEHLSPLQVEQLEAASRLVREPLRWNYENGTIQIDVDLPPHAVAAITLDLASERRPASVHP